MLLVNNVYGSVPPDLPLIDTTADIHCAGGPRITLKKDRGRFTDRAGNERACTEDEIRRDIRASDLCLDVQLPYYYNTDSEHPELPPGGFCGYGNVGEAWADTFHDIANHKNYQYWVDAKQKYNPNFIVLRYSAYYPRYVRGGKQYPDPEYSSEYETLYLHTKRTPGISNRCVMAIYTPEDWFAVKGQSDYGVFLPFSRSTGGEFGGTPNNDYVYKAYICDPTIPADPDDQHYLIGRLRKEFRRTTQDVGYDGIYMDMLVDHIKSSYVPDGGLPYGYNEADFRTKTHNFAGNLKDFLNTLPENKIYVGNALFYDDPAMRYKVNAMLGENWAVDLDGYVPKSQMLSQIERVMLYNKVPTGTILHNMCHGGYTASVEDIQRRLYLLGMYLIVKGKYTWMLAGDGVGSYYPPFPELQIKIGKAVGTYTAEGSNDVFKRQFTRCWAVVSPNESGTKTTSLSTEFPFYYRLGIDLTKGLSPADVGRLTYTSVNPTGISVPARTGIILMKPQGLYVSNLAWTGDVTVVRGQQPSGHISTNALNLHTASLTNATNVNLKFYQRGTDVDISQHFTATRIDGNDTSFNLGEHKGFRWNVEVGKSAPGDSVYVVPTVEGKDRGGKDTPANSLIANGGFEFDHLAWRYRGLGSGSIDRAKKYRGSKSARISMPTKHSGYYESAHANVIPDDELILQGWIKTSNVVGNGASIRIQYYKTNWTYMDGCDAEGKMITGTQDWTRYTMCSKVPIGAAYYKVKLNMDNTAGTAWFDDISLLIGFSWNITG